MDKDLQGTEEQSSDQSKRTNKSSSRRRFIKTEAVLLPYVAPLIQTFVLDEPAEANGKGKGKGKGKGRVSNVPPPPPPPPGEEDDDDDDWNLLESEVRFLVSL